MLRTFVFAGLLALTLGQLTCPPSEVLFLLDESENAERASTRRTSFDILQEAIDDFLRNVSRSNNDFRVGAISYSSNTAQVVIRLGSNPRQAQAEVRNIGRLNNGGSWTHRGLEEILRVNARPSYANSLLIVVSSQGSGTGDRRRQAGTAAGRVIRELGWRPYVIVPRGVNPVDIEEMRIVNNNQDPVILDNGAQPPRNYEQLGDVLNFVINNILCPFVPPTTTTTRAPVTRPPRTGICSDCLFDAGYGFDFDPDFCDSYYVCVPQQAPIRRSCPAGTFWSGSTCDFMENVNCAVATCIPSTPRGTRYPSGRCCNKYFECNDGVLYDQTCPSGQVYSQPQRACISVRDDRAVCDLQGRYMCDVQRGGSGGGLTDCGEYSPDPFGNPCRFMFGGYSIDTPPGTMWDQGSCSLIFARTGQCGEIQGGARRFFGESPADICNAVFLATFDNRRRTVFSERQNSDLNVSVSLNEARLEQNGLVFEPNMRRPYGYYYFFNNRAVQENTAFRVRFRLDDNTGGNRRYDILSNNFCDLCRETISITVTPRGPRQREVTATFVLTNGQTVSTSAIINMEIESNLLEVTTVIGPDAIYGQVSELRGTGPNSGALQTENFNRVAKPSGVEVQPNRCGYMLGQGPNSNFVGLIDDFAVFEYCADINQVLGRRV